jgi:hypothetical protein
MTVGVERNGITGVLKLTVIFVHQRRVLSALLLRQNKGWMDHHVDLPMVLMEALAKRGLEEVVTVVTVCEAACITQLILRQT